MDIPDKIGAAHVYLTYFHHSVRHRYLRDDLEVVTYLDQPIPAIVATLTASTDKNSNDPSEVSLFRWDDKRNACCCSGARLRPHDTMVPVMPVRSKEKKFLAR